MISIFTLYFECPYTKFVKKFKYMLAPSCLKFSGSNEVSFPTAHTYLSLGLYLIIKRIINKF